MIRRRIRAAGQTTVQARLAPELRRVPRSRRRVDDVSLAGDNRARLVSLECPSQLPEHHDPEFGEVRVEVPAIVRSHGLIGSCLSADQVASRPVLADGFLRPVFLRIILRCEIVDVEMDRPWFPVWVGYVERVRARAQPNRNVLDTR